MSKKPSTPLFADPALSRRHMKIVVSGGWGGGKTHFGLTFPRPVIIDPEHGTDMFVGRTYQTPDGPKVFDFKASYSRSIYKAIELVEYVIDNPGEFETLVIDPITLLWEQAQDAYIETLEKKVAAGTSKRDSADIAFGDWKNIKKPYKKLMTLLMGVPAHVIVTGRLKDDYTMKDGQPTKTGESLDAEKSTPYVADIFMRIFRQGSKRLGEVLKDRSSTLEGQIFENPGYWSFIPIVNNLKGAKVTTALESDEEATKKDVAAIVSSEYTVRSKALMDRLAKGRMAIENFAGAEDVNAILTRISAIETAGNASFETIESVINDAVNVYRIHTALKGE